MAESIFEATGVPLVDELMRFKTVEAAAQFAAQRAALVVGGALLGILLLKAIDRYFGRRIEKSGTSDFNIVGAAASAAFKPIQVGSVHTCLISVGWAWPLARAPPWARQA